MDRTTRIPRSIMIDEFRCKILYRGQPVTCDVCKEEGHVATKCSKKVLVLIVTSRGMCPVTALMVPMAEALGASCPNVSPWFPSQMGPLVVGPLPLWLVVLNPVVGVGPSGEALSSPAPLSSGGGGSSDGGVAPVSVPDSELSLSVCEDSSAASIVLNSQGYIISNEDNALRNANDIDNTSSKVSNSSNVSCGNVSSNVSDSAICTVSSASNAVNVNKLDNVASNAKTSAGNAVACSSVDSEPKSCSSTDLNSNGSPALGEPVADASVEVSPSPSQDTEMVPLAGYRKRP